MVVVDDTTQTEKGDSQLDNEGSDTLVGETDSGPIMADETPQIGKGDAQLNDKDEENELVTIGRMEGV